MKKIYIIIILTLLNKFTNAQFSVGNKLIGPSFSFSTSSNSSEQPANVFSTGYTTGINLGISYIKMKQPNTGVGFNIGAGYTTVKNEANGITNLYNNYSFSAGILRRRYLPLINGINFFYDAGVNITYNRGSNQYTGISSQNKLTNTGLNTALYAAPGISFFLNKKLLIDAQLANLIALNVGQSVNKDGNGNTYKNTFLSANSSLSANNLFNSISFSIKWIL